MGQDGLVFDGGQAAEAVLAPAAVVDAFDPVHDRRSQLVSGGPGLSVEDLVLQQGEEALHGGVVPACTDSPHGSDEAVVGEYGLHLRGSEPRSSIAV